MAAYRQPTMLKLPFTTPFGRMSQLLQEREEKVQSSACALYIAQVSNLYQLKLEAIYVTDRQTFGVINRK